MAGGNRVKRVYINIGTYKIFVRGTESNTWNVSQYQPGVKDRMLDKLVK